MEGEKICRCGVELGNIFKLYLLQATMDVCRQKASSVAANVASVPNLTQVSKSHLFKEAKQQGDPLIFNFLLLIMALWLCIRENKQGKNNITKTFKIHHVGPALRISGNETTHIGSRRQQSWRPFKLLPAPTSLGASKT